MSWKASAWAKEQRLGSPAAKSILMCLADYADPEGFIKGWASQAELADAAEVSERTAREWLQRLEDWGLLSRERQQRPSGARAADWIVLKLDVRIVDGVDRCRADREGGSGASLPAEIAGRTNRQPDAEPTGNEAHPTGSQFRAYKDKPPIEPPLPSHQERAEAREREDSIEDRKKIDAAYWRMIKVWPRLKGIPKQKGLKAFAALSPEDRETAERRFPAWLALLKAQGKDHVHQPSTYFGDRLFADVPEPEPQPINKFAPPFGKLWGALRLLHLLQPFRTLPRASSFLEGMMAEDSERGERERLAHRSRHGWPVVNDMHERAKNKRGCSVPDDKAWLETVAADFESLRVGSDQWQEWKVEHERRGWPWVPDPGLQEWVYFPAGGPAGLEAFEAAISGEGSGNDGGQREAAE